MITARSTKAELVAHIAVQDSKLLAFGRVVQNLRDDVAMSKSAPVLPLGKLDYSAYFNYVRECKVAQRGQRVCTYKSYVQWSAA